MNSVEIEQALSKFLEEPLIPLSSPISFLNVLVLNQQLLVDLKNGETNKSDLSMAFY